LRPQQNAWSIVVTAQVNSIPAETCVLVAALAAVGDEAA
jgi:hypothetical protein